MVNQLTELNMNLAEKIRKHFELKEEIVNYKEEGDKTEASLIVLETISSFQDIIFPVEGDIHYVDYILYVEEDGYNKLPDDVKNHCQEYDMDFILEEDIWVELIPEFDKKINIIKKEWEKRGFKAELTTYDNNFKVETDDCEYEKTGEDYKYFHKVILKALKITWFK